MLLLYVRAEGGRCLYLPGPSSLHSVYAAPMSASSQARPELQVRLSLFLLPG